MFVAEVRLENVEIPCSLPVVEQPVFQLLDGRALDAVRGSEGGDGVHREDFVMMLCGVCV